MPDPYFNKHLNVDFPENKYRCPRCGRNVRGAAASQGDKREEPTVGDLCICNACGMVSRFGETKLEPFSQNDFVMLDEDMQQNLKETAIALGCKSLFFLKNKQQDS